MRESLKIIFQCLNFLILFKNFNDFTWIDNKITPGSRLNMKYDMESLIHHFKFYTDNLIINLNETYSVVEAPKGEFGVYIKTNNSNKPYRCRIKSPGFLHLQGLDFMSKNLYLADLVTIIGTQDLVFGEVDR